MSYHKWVSTGLQRAETDAKQHDRRERVVVDEPSAVGIAVPPIQRQVNVGVAREKHWAKLIFRVMVCTPQYTLMSRSAVERD